MTYYNYACKKTSDVVNVAKLYFWEVYRLHELPLFIVFDEKTLGFLANFGDAFNVKNTDPYMGDSSNKRSNSRANSLQLREDYVD
jgi:hypothetical protein